MIRIGIAGLGRLGARHALNLVQKVRGAELAAACSIVESEREWAVSELGIRHVHADFGEMLESGGLDAVFIVTSSAGHAAQSVQALEAGLHVFVEKPMGVSVEECRMVETAAAAHPDRVFMVGFVRRYDPSYAQAKRLIDSGAIGTPFLVRSQTVDLDEYAAFQIRFIGSAGGIFLDMNIHDIDLARWYLGGEIASVHAIGGSYVYPEFGTAGDADNTVALARFDNGKMAVISCSRTAFHGHDTHTEITGTRGTLKIGMTPAASRVEIFDAAGARVECVRDFYERFREGFEAEAQEFVDCIAEHRKPGVSAHDGTKATEAGFALTQSFRERRIIELPPC
jgi:myo-inositol 2-dehydrogenase/D-chiro-inositol 1-dehydrogenase